MTTVTHLHEDESDAAHAHAHADVWLSDVTAGYGERTALEHVTVAVEPGSLLAVVGPNGAGKSTMLKLMAGLLEPWSGRIEILGAPAGREARRVAYVPQAELVDWAFPVTVEDVVMMGRFPRLGSDPPTRPRRSPGRRGRAGAGRHGPSPPDADRAPVGRPAPARVPRPGPRRGAGPVPARRAGDRHRRDHAGAADGPPRGPGEARQDGRRDDPRPGLRGPALPAGARGQPHGRRVRPVEHRPRRRRPRGAPTAATCSCSRDGP